MAATLKGAAEAAHNWKAGLGADRHLTTNRQGFWLFLRSASVYVLLFLGAFLLPTPWMRSACLLIMPLSIAALFVVGHDAAHHTLTPSRWLNRILGRLCLLPSYHTYTSWRHAHNTLHHGGTCLKGKHPDFAPFDKREFDALPAWRQGLERVYRAPLGVGLYYAMDFYRRYMLFPSGQNRSRYRELPGHRTAPLSVRPLRRSRSCGACLGLDEPEVRRSRKACGCLDRKAAGDRSEKFRLR